jgi:hypothetical protein
MRELMSCQKYQPDGLPWLSDCVTRSKFDVHPARKATAVASWLGSL